MRRIVAVVLPHLVCDLAREGLARARGDPRRALSPLAVLVDSYQLSPRREGSEEVDPRESSDVIAAIDDAAYRAGVRVGQRVSEAMAYSAHLSIAHLQRSRIDAALATVAEVGLSFGAVAHVVPFMGTDGLKPPPTRVRRAKKPGLSKGAGVVRAPPSVWLDVTGAAHLFGGEDALLDELEERLRSLGFSADAAIADGPRIAEALARYRHVPGAVRVAPPTLGAEALAPLSIDSLPLGDEVRSLFVRLGVFTVGDFAKLPRAQVSARLGDRAGEIMALAMGHDLFPLEPYRAPEVLIEETSFDDGVETAPQLLFVSKAMISRLSARLEGRAQATHRIEMSIAFDKSIYRLRQPSQQAVDEAPRLLTVVDLPAALSQEGDLLRAIKAKLERIELAAPAVSIRIELSRVTAAPRVQLDLSRDVAVSPTALPALLSELSAEIGASRLGVLAVVDAYRPEKRSLLVPVSCVLEKSVLERSTFENGSTSKRENRAAFSFDARAVDRSEPTRLLQVPVLLGHVDDEGSIVKQGVARLPPLGGSYEARVGEANMVRSRAPLFVGHEAHVLERVIFDRRLETVEWWSKKPASRDYLRVVLSRRDLSSGNNPTAKDESVHACEAFVYVDRRTREVFLQGWWE